jgi:DNA-binding transcriptional MerR regulator
MSGQSVGDVAARFGVAVSTLHWWEKSGLLAPQRRSGRRVYHEVDLRRIALIQLLQGTAGMNLPDIAAVLDGGHGDRHWREIVQDRVAVCEQQFARLEAVRAYLTHLWTCPSEHLTEECPYLAARIDANLADGAPGR